MPLHWKIAPLEHMVVCVAEGAVTIDELMAYFAALDAAGASNYRKILDATRATAGLSEADLGRLAAYARSLGWQGTPGPMAVVTGTGGNEPLVANVKAMLRLGRRMREFQTIHEARQWLDGEQPGRPS
ncbi:MAG: hypothetical protein FJX11_17270 [Alphaproteobacteria bacterium]|nr:hypothetical protein [Alphaproteobacteria bacterium]